MTGRWWARFVVGGLLVPSGCYTGLEREGSPFDAGYVPYGDDAGDDADGSDGGEADDDGDDGVGDGDGDGVGDGVGDGGEGDDDAADDADDGADDAGLDDAGLDDAGDVGDTGDVDDGGDMGDGGDSGDGGDAGDDGGDGGPMGDEVPDNAYCDPVSGWQAGWSSLEQDVLDLVNAARATGGNCGSQGNFGPSAPLSMSGALRCAARNHSKNMADGDFFAHTAPNGETPWDRIAASGYGGYQTAGENIAAGYPSPQAVVDGWLDSDGHCANMLKADFEEIGVGYYAGGSYGSYWTQKFATQ